MVAAEARFDDGELLSVAENSVFQPIEYEPMVSESGIAYSMIEVGSKPGKPTFGRVSKQVDRVLKGLGKQCGMAVQAVPKLEAAQLFPKAGG